MSAGPFSRARYQCGDGTIAVIRVQPETIALTIDGEANAQATGAVNAKLRVRSSKGKREYGLGARMVRMEWIGTVPDGYKPGGVLQVPILQESVYDGINLLDEGVYLGNPVRVIGKSDEDVR